MEENKRVYTDIELNDMDFLDSLTLEKKQRTKGLISAVLLTGLGLFVYFVPVNVGGSSQNLFGWLWDTLMAWTGVYGLWFSCLLMVLNTIGCFVGKFASKPGTWLHKLYDGDSKIHPFLYLIGTVYMVIFMFDYQFAWFTGPEFIVSPDVGGTIIEGFIPSFLWVIPLGALTLPLLLNYGGIDFFGTLLEPIMRKAYRVPGKSAVDAISSFFASSSVAVLITNNLYRSRVYTEREAVIITTGFSAVSVGFASVVINTAGLGDDFTGIYFVSMLIAFLITFICCRIPPITWKRNVYVDGAEQTDEDRKKTYTDGVGTFSRAVSRAAKKGALSENYFTCAKAAVVEALPIVPKVLTFATAAGVSCLILTIYTPIFEWIGLIFKPLLVLLGVEMPELVGSALFTGLGEMYLPVLMIKSNVDVLSAGTRFFVATVSIVQMIFFSETASIQLGLKMPVKWWELVVIFFERTIIAIPITAIFMHILY